MTDYVKLIAQAIAGDEGGAKYWIDDAETIIAALDAKGLVIVPREHLTNAMIVTGGDEDS